MIFLPSACITRVLKLIFTSKKNLLIYIKFSPALASSPAPNCIKSH